MESGLYKREGRAISNFSSTLPSHNPILPIDLKDPYIFDFVSMSDDYNERDLEKGLTEHLTHFLWELGAGFAL